MTGPHLSTGYVLLLGSLQPSLPRPHPLLSLALCYGLNYELPKDVGVLTPRTCEWDLIWK